MNKSKASVHKTKNSLPEKVRIQVAGSLQDRLADSIDLMIQAKQAHWNVKGPSFIALHELFDKLSEDSEEYVDLLAERIVQLGGVTEGTIRLAAKKSQLPEYPLSAVAGKDHVEALSRSLAVYGESVRKAIDDFDELGDKATADIMTEISRGADKYLWFIESHTLADR
jgi:starvation-inducible DNA-binding protein